MCKSSGGSHSNRNENIFRFHGANNERRQPPTLISLSCHVVYSVHQVTCTRKGLGILLFCVVEIKKIVIALISEFLHHFPKFLFFRNKNF